MEELGYKWCYNVPYFPDGNGIEFIFAMEKRLFKAKKLKEIVMNKHTATNILVK